MTKTHIRISLFTSVVLALQPLAGFAHTTLETVTMGEGVRVLNNEQIGHACGTGTSVIGTSAVFPDGKDSTLLVNGQPYTGLLSDFISNWGPNIQPLTSRAVFDMINEKNDANGNVVGFWGAGGPGMPANMVAYIPFRVNATNFNPLSCATSVKFHVSIVDVCKVTNASHLRDAGVANFWTSPTLGTVYDTAIPGDDVAALTITRNLGTNPMPSSCGGVGTSVDVRSSASQLNRDMPVRINGVQVWPQP